MSSDREIGDRLNDFLQDDQTNLKAIEEVAAKFGGGSPQPRDTIRQYTEQVKLGRFAKFFGEYTKTWHRSLFIFDKYLQHTIEI